MKRNLAIIAILFVIAPHISLAQTFSVQGVLRDPLGKTVADGTYSLTFKLYEQQTGGTAVWTETQGSVAVLHGVFTAELGVSSSLSSVPFDTTYYLGISIEGGTELSPRFKLTKAPAAMSTLGTNNVFPSVGNIGAGTTNPSAALHIVAQSGVTNDLLIEDASGNPKLVVNDDNRVGVGVSSPEGALHIKPADDIAPKLLIQATDGSDKVVVTGAGKLGVGVPRDSVNDPLTVNGNLRLQNGGAIVFDDGTQIASADFGGSATGVTSPGNALITADSDGDAGGEVQLVTGSTTRMVVTNSGNVGIGTDSPGSKLEVDGYVKGTRFVDDDASYFADLNTGGLLGGYWGINKQYTNVALNVRSDLENLLYLEKSDGTGVFSVNQTGASGNGSGLTNLSASNITTGTISDSYLESTVNTTNFNASGWMQASMYYDDDSDYFADLNTGGLLGGYWGINKQWSNVALNVRSDLEYLLYIEKSDGTGVFSVNQTGASGNGSGLTNLSASNITTGTISDSYLESTIDRTNFNASAKITADYVAIGGATASSNVPLRAKQSSYNLGFQLVDYNSDAYWEWAFPQNDQNLNLIYYDGSDRTYRAWVSSSNGSWNASSDIRLKENITDLEPVLDKLMSLGTYRFNFKDRVTDAGQIGFTAQNLEKQFPEFVSESGDGYKGVSYAQMTPVLVKAIQEQQEQIDTQADEIESLKQDIGRLTARLEALEKE